MAGNIFAPSSGSVDLGRHAVMAIGWKLGELDRQIGYEGEKVLPNLKTKA